MSNDCQDDESESGDVRISYPFNAWGHAYNIAEFLAALAGVVSTFFTITAKEFASHNNDLVDRRFERKQRRLLIDDLESLERGERP